MINIKITEEIEIMRHAGKILADVLFEVLEHANPGVSEIELDRLAEKLILEKGGQPAFKRVSGYKHTICVSTNEVVVHGIPTDYKLKEGDVLGIDCGVYYKGFNTDMAETIQVKTLASRRSGQNSKIKNPEIEKFLQVGKKALEKGIKQVKEGNRVGNISKAIQDIVEKESGYSVVRSLIGHGVGKDLHEEPEVPGFLVGKIEMTPLLKTGMTIAVEVIYNMGKSDVVYSNDDGWTISTKDNSISGLFERTVEITKVGSTILTQ